MQFSESEVRIALAIVFALIAIPAMAGASRRDEEGRLGDAMAITGIVVLIGIGFMIYQAGI